MENVNDKSNKALIFSLISLFLPILSIFISFMPGDIGFIFDFYPILFVIVSLVTLIFLLIGLFLGIKSRKANPNNLRALLSIIISFLVIVFIIFGFILFSSNVGNF